MCQLSLIKKALFSLLLKRFGKLHILNKLLYACY